MSAPNIINPPAGGGGTPIGGSGTTGTLPIWTASSTLGDSAIVQAAGAIKTLVLTTAGTGGTAGTYREQAITNVTGTGSSATADISVTAGAVTQVFLRAAGSGYAVGDTLSAAITGLTGAVFTVTAITTSDNAAGNVTANRIAAGSSSATTGLSTNAGLLSTTAPLLFGTNSSGTASQYRAMALFNMDGEPSTQAAPTAVENASNAGVVSISRWNFAARTSNTSGYGVFGQSAIVTQNASASGFAYGGLFTAVASSPTLSGASLNNIGVFAQASVSSTVTSSNTITTMYAHDCALTCFATAVQTISNAGYFVPRVASFSGAAHAVNSWYGIYLREMTLSNGSTILNRYNFAQDDVNGRNSFRSKVFVGAVITAAQQTAASVEIEATNTLLTGTITAGGTLYTDGTYTNQVFTGGSPTVASRGNFVVSGGIVTSVTIVSGGEGYAVGNVLSTSLPAGSGFQWTVATVQGNGDVRLRSNSAVFDASNSSTNGLKLFNRAGTGQTSSTLSWYEEGSYTPTFSAAWTPGTYTATWTRIGRKVFVTINFASGTTNGTSGAATITVPAGLTPARAGLGLRGRPDGTASGSGLVAVDTAGLIQISTAITLDTNAKVIQAEYEV
jgi:hypothetical protein